MRSCNTDGRLRSLSASSRIQAISILCRLLIDRTVIFNSHVVVAVEEALDSLIDAIAGDCPDDDVSVQTETFSVALLVEPTSSFEPF